MIFILNFGSLMKFSDISVVINTKRQKNATPYVMDCCINLLHIDTYFVAFVFLEVHKTPSHNNYNNEDTS